MSHKKSTSQQYVEDYNNWQQNQHIPIPGNYTGKSYESYLNIGGKKFKFGTLILGLFLLMLGLYIIPQNDGIKVGAGMIILGLIFTYISWKKIKRNKRK